MRLKNLLTFIYTALSLIYDNRYYSPQITKGAELVVIPREEYEDLLRRQIPEFTSTETEKRDLARARRNRARGNYLTIDELKRKLGFTSFKGDAF